MITEIFGDNCLRAKVFDLLLSHPHIDYTKTDIAECAEVSRGSLNKFIDELVEYGIIKPTRKIGNSQLYKINLDSQITQALNSFQNQLADIEMEKEMIEYQKSDPEIEPIKPFEEIAKKKLESKGYPDYLSSSSAKINKPVSRPMVITAAKAFAFETDSFGTEEYTSVLTATGGKQKERAIQFD